MSKVTGFSRAQIGIHWATLLVIGVNYVSSDGMKDAWRAVGKAEAVTGNGYLVHILAGCALLMLTLYRLMTRMKLGAPDAPDGTNALLDLAGRLGHLGLYLLLFGIPLSGLTAWVGNIRTLGGVHELLFNLLFLLAGLHAAAALFHHFVLKDGLLNRMRKAGR